MSTTATAQFENAESLANTAPSPALPLRGDTILGVCEAVGQDLGFNPIFLRIPFAALLMWNPAVIIGTYLTLGAIVALSRWLFPVQDPSAAAKSVAQSSEAAPAAEVRNEVTEERLAA